MSAVAPLPLTLRVVIEQLADPRCRRYHLDHELNSSVPFTYTRGIQRHPEDYGLTEVYEALDPLTQQILERIVNVRGVRKIKICLYELKVKVGLAFLHEWGRIQSDILDILREVYNASALELLERSAAILEVIDLQPVPQIDPLQGIQLEEDNSP